MRLKKLARAKKPRRSNRFTLAVLSKRFAHVKNAQGFTWAAGAIAIGAVAICIAVGAMLNASLHTGAPAAAATTLARNPTPPQPRPTPISVMPDEVVATAAPRKAPAPDSPVTITGCLEQDDETFRLKNTTGTQAPKSRSWKSGFLKKNPASIEIVDASNKVRLPNHVGQRVVVTGLLVNREMQVRSLRRVATSCNQSA
jgi:hypothetical protein